MISARCLAKIIEFIFKHDGFIEQAIQTKETKYNLLIGVIKSIRLETEPYSYHRKSKRRNTHKKCRTPPQVTIPNGTNKKNRENLFTKLLLSI